LRLAEAEKLILTADRYDAGAMKGWLRYSKPEVILANFEETFPQVGQISDHALSYAALNWNKNSPEIAGIDQNRSAIGEQAVDLLLLRLQANKLGLDPLAPSIHVPGVWVNGTSLQVVAPIPAKRVIVHHSPKA